MIRYIKQKYTKLLSDPRFSEIFTGSVWALSARVLSTVIGLVFSVLVARLYGSEMVGIVAIINSFLTLITIFTVMGTATSILRLVPEHLTKYSATSAFKVYRKTQYMVIFVSLITSTLLFFSSGYIADKIFSKPHFSFYIGLASAFVVFQSIMQLNTQAVRGLRQIRLFAFMLTLPPGSKLIILLIVGLLVPHKDIPVYSVLCGFAITGVFGWLIMGSAFKKRMHGDDKVHPLTCRQILSISLPMLLASAMMFFIAQTGVLILGIFRPETEVGFYAIAVKLATLTSFVLQAVNSMAGPNFSELFHSGKIDDLFIVAKKSAKLIFFTSLPILMGLLIFGKPILSIVFGHDFVVAYSALVILVGGQFINAVSGSTGVFMNMTGNQKAFSKIMIMVAIMNVSLNLFLTPRFGMNGTAIAAAISLCCWNITTLVYMKLKFGKTTGYFPLVNRLKF